MQERGEGDLFMNTRDRHFQAGYIYHVLKRSVLRQTLFSSVRLSLHRTKRIAGKSCRPRGRLAMVWTVASTVRFQRSSGFELAGSEADGLGSSRESTVIAQGIEGNPTFILFASL
jgi:hypothetical protein